MTFSSTGTQTRTLAECEAQFISGDWARAEALKYIRDHRLYPKKGGFEHYCLDKWDLGKHYVNRLIRAYEIKIEQQAHLGPLETMLGESHYREISRLKDERSRTAAIRKIRDRFKDSRLITAAQIKEIVDEMSAKVSAEAKKTEPISTAGEFDEDEPQTETEPIGAGAETEKHSLDDFDADVAANIRPLLEQYGRHYKPEELFEHAEQTIKRMAADTIHIHFESRPCGTTSKDEGV